MLETPNSESFVSLPDHSGDVHEGLDAEEISRDVVVGAPFDPALVDEDEVETAARKRQEEIFGDWTMDKAA